MGATEVGGKPRECVSQKPNKSVQGWGVINCHSDTNRSSKIKTEN